MRNFTRQDPYNPTYATPRGLLDQERSDHLPSQKIRFSEFEADFSQRELRKGGVRIRLQHKPFRILEMLLRQPGELVSRQELAEALWPGLHVSFERGLNTAVNVLRQTLGDSLMMPLYQICRASVTALLSRWKKLLNRLSQPTP